MSPVTHGLIGWWTANVVPLSRRDRLLVFLAALLPDLDGFGLLYSWEVYVKYHHVLSHNLIGCVVCAAAVGLLAQEWKKCVVLAILNWHLHLACDYFGSRGPMTTPPWVLPYFFPFVGGWEGEIFVGPAWYWNPWQWPLNGWQNLAVTALGLVGWFYIALRLDRTWFEFLWPRGDALFCQTLRRWLGVEAAAPAWSPVEAVMIRRSYLMVTIAALFTCVVTAARV